MFLISFGVPSGLFLRGLAFPRNTASCRKVENAMFFEGFGSPCKENARFSNTFEVFFDCRPEPAAIWFGLLLGGSASPQLLFFQVATFCLHFAAEG